MPSECAAGRVVVVPCWPQSRHRQIAVSTDAMASMLITSVAGKQRVTVMVCPFPERRVTEVGPAGRGERDGGMGLNRRPTGLRRK